MIACLLALVSSAAAQTTTATPIMTGTRTAMQEATTGQPNPAYPSDWFEPIKKPTPWFEWGGDLRLRDNYQVNVKSLDRRTLGNEEHYQRYRTRLYGKVTPVDNEEFGKLDVVARLTWEFYSYCRPKGVEGTSLEDIRDTSPNEALFDNLYVKWSKVLGQPLTLTVGRQDLMDLGNTWLIVDGTPVDGSRTAFFDAVRATYEFKDAKTLVDLIYADNASDSDRIIKPFCDKDRALIESDERAVILYARNRSLKNTQIDAYYIYKHDNPELSSGKRAQLHTFGARVIHDFDEHWRVDAELAEQLGHFNLEDQCATGFNGRLTYRFGDAWNTELRMYYEYLSGDDPDTDTHEGFDILWGRYARFSEVWPYTIAMETGRGADYTNMHRVGWGAWTRPLGKCEMDRHGQKCPGYYPLELGLDYNLLFTDQNTLAGTAGFSDSGCFRGQLITGWLFYRFNEHIFGHLMGDVLIPGDYYTNSKNDIAVFARYELSFQW
jgi:hypothetical protein